MRTRDQVNQYRAGKYSSYRFMLGNGISYRTMSAVLRNKLYTIKELEEAVREMLWGTRKLKGIGISRGLELIRLLAEK